MTAVITTAATADDWADFAALVDQYVDWCRTRYAHDAWFVDQVFGHQSLAAELEGLPAKYGPPQGRALLLRENGAAAGCIAYRRIGDGIAEMKRLFVSARHTGKGHGRTLCNALIAAAREDGYHLMRLDTATLLTEAIALYEKAGFRRCAPYNEYPDALAPYIIFMDRKLT